MLLPLAGEERELRDLIFLGENITFFLKQGSKNAVAHLRRATKNLECANGICNDAAVSSLCDVMAKLIGVRCYEFLRATKIHRKFCSSVSERFFLSRDRIFPPALASFPSVKLHDGAFFFARVCVRLGFLHPRLFIYRGIQLKMLRNHEPSGGLAGKPPGYVTVGAGKTQTCCCD